MPIHWNLIRYFDSRDLRKAESNELAYITNLQFNLAYYANYFSYSETFNVLWYLINAALEHRENVLSSLPNIANKRFEPAVEKDLMKRLQLWKESSIFMDELVRSKGGVYLEFIQPNLYLSNSKPMTDVENNIVKNGFDGRSLSQMQTLVNAGYKGILEQLPALRCPAPL